MYNNDLSTNYYTKENSDSKFLNKSGIITGTAWSGYLTCNKNIGNFVSATASIPQVSGYTPICVIPMGFENRLIEFTVNLVGFSTTTINFYLIGINNTSAIINDVKVGFLVVYKAN